MSLILDPQKNFINITTFYVEKIKDRGNSVFAFIDSKEELDAWIAKGYVVIDEKEKQDNNKLIKKITTTWRRPTWKEHNMMISRSLKPNQSPEGKRYEDIDPIVYNELKFKTCLKKWDLKDELGEPIPVTPENIDCLEPSVADKLMRDFTRVTEPTEEDLKN